MHLVEGDFHARHLVAAARVGVSAHGIRLFAQELDDLAVRRRRDGAALHCKHMTRNRQHTPRKQSRRHLGLHTLTATSPPLADAKAASLKLQRQQCNCSQDVVS